MPQGGPVTPAAGDAVRIYTLTYDELDRRLGITFEASFPHRVLAWSEGPHSDPAGTQTTRATLTHTTMLDYWRHNGADDAAYRDMLGLTF